MYAHTAQDASKSNKGDIKLCSAAYINTIAISSWTNGARGKRRRFSAGAAARHSQSARAHVDRFENPLSNMQT